MIWLHNTVDILHLLPAW